MLSHFESRLADVLGSRLPAPFAGRVFVAPGPAGPAPTLLVGVSRAEVLPTDFGSVRPEVVPGADDPRRVVRMRCTVRIEVRASDAGGRAEALAALDAVLYELGAPDLRNAAALGGPVDPGFVLSGQTPQEVVIEGADVADDRLPAVLLEAEGWFWPPNVPGITGRPIRSALVRAAFVPVALEPWPLDLRVGDAALSLTVRVGSVGTMELTEAAPVAVPFGALSVRVVDAGGRPGAGALSGGTPGPSGSRTIALVGGVAQFAYTPPAAPARDVLVVCIAHPDTGGGVEIGSELARFDLDVGA